MSSEPEISAMCTHKKDLAIVDDDWGSTTLFGIRNFALGLGAGLFGLSVGSFAGHMIEAVDGSLGLSYLWEDRSPPSSPKTRVISVTPAKQVLSIEDSFAGTGDKVAEAETESGSEASELPADQAKLLAELEAELNKSSIAGPKAHSEKGHISSPKKFIPALNIPENGCHTGALMDANSALSSFQRDIKMGPQSYWIGTNPGTAAASPKATPRDPWLVTPKRRPQTSQQPTSRSEAKLAEAPPSSRVPPTHLPRKLPVCWPPKSQGGSPTPTSPMARRYTIGSPVQDAPAVEKNPAGGSVGGSPVQPRSTPSTPTTPFSDPYEARKEVLREKYNKAKEEDAFTEVQLRRRPGTVDIWSGSPGLPPKGPRTTQGSTKKTPERVEAKVETPPCGASEPTTSRQRETDSEEYSLLRMLSARRRLTGAAIAVESPSKAHPAVKMAETLEAWSFPSLGIFDSTQKSGKTFSSQVQDLAQQLDTEVMVSREMARTAAKHEKDIAAKEQQVEEERHRVLMEKKRVQELLEQMEQERRKAAREAAELRSSLSCKQQQETILRRKQESFNASICEFFGRYNGQQLTKQCFVAWTQMLQKRHMRRREKVAKENRQVLTQMLRIMEDQEALSSKTSKSTTTALQCSDGSVLTLTSKDGVRKSSRSPTKPARTPTQMPQDRDGCTSSSSSSD